jgi:LPS O-antigen subunit length determinant protein (WzzB/FepE family)
MKNNNKNLEYFQDDEIDIGNLLKILWNDKFKILIITSIFTISSVFYALSLPNIYTSSVLLAPSDSKNSMSSGLSGAASLAGLAGINLPVGQSSNKPIEAIERIRTYDFFVAHFLPYIKYENLVATKSWSSDTNIIQYTDAFDGVTGKWKNNNIGKPSNQISYKKFLKSIEINKNSKTSFVTISFSHHSPIVSKEWLDLIVKNINKVMQDEDRLLLQDSVSFLTSALEKNNIKAVDKALNSLLESQIQGLMLVNTNSDYIFKSIDSPISPEEKSSPQRSIIVIVGIFIGIIVSIFVIIILNLQRHIKD